jgi:hypothetical protein
MGRRGAIALLLLASTLVAGCAGSQMTSPPSLINEQAPDAGPSPQGYQLSTSEQKYDCKKLAGVMQVRILQIRGYDSRRQASAAARGMQSITTPIFGGSTAEMDPDGQYRKDVAMLKAYNQRLAQKNCNTFDLESDLKGTGLLDAPRPLRPGKKQGK